MAGRRARGRHVRRVMALRCRSDHCIICDFSCILWIFFIDMTVDDVGDDEREGRASAPMPNTAA
jgi:hypothetical protein